MKENKINIPHIPFYFARHGKTDWNKKNKVMGQIDIPLNEVGIEQARIVAKQLSHLDISHIISSPLKRAIQTSEIIAKTMNVSVIAIEELNNAFVGIMEGKDRGDGKWLEDWRMGVEIEDAESWPEFVTRVASGLKKALSQTPDKKTILIIGHGPTYWALLHILNALTDVKKAENCGVYYFSPPNSCESWRVSTLG